MDDQQRARELLAQEYERDGITHVPDCIRREAMLTEMENRAVRAITAALRAAPEGFVMVPVELFHEVSDVMGRFLSDEGWGQKDMDVSDDFGALLAARPQEASDA